MIQTKIMKDDFMTIILTIWLSSDLDNNQSGLADRTPEERK